MSVQHYQQQVCDALREIEHHSNDNDELFYCSYLLGLLGLQASEDLSSVVEFNQYFTEQLTSSMQQEKLNQADQTCIQQLWSGLKKQYSI